MRDRSGIEFRADYRRQVECGVCGCVYAVGDPKRFIGQGRTDAAAQRDADEQARGWAAGKKPKGPCPACGGIPAGVVAKRRRFRHSVATAPSLVAFVMVFTFASKPIPLDTEFVASIVAAVAVLSGLLHAGIAARNLQGDAAANRQRADAALRRGEVTILHPGGPIDPTAFTRASRRRVVAAVVFGMVTAAFALAGPALRLFNGWPTNDQLVPGECGPGDEVRVYFGQRLDAIDYRWNGRPIGTVEYTVAGAAKRLPAVVQGQQLTWDDKIYNQNRSQTAYPWAALTIPADATPGDVLRVELDMRVKYPTPAGPDRFTETEVLVHQKRDIRLATPGAAPLSTQLFWGGTIGAAVLVVLLGLFLSETSFPARIPANRVTAEPV
ncbi:MAG: hypothetical protein U0804_24440 [Gemmataceae bacterium]